MRKDTTGNRRANKKRFNYFFYDFVKITGIIPVWIWLHPRVYHFGDKKKHNIKGQMLVVSNHVGFRDPLILLCAFFRRRLFALITKDLYKTKIMSFILNAIHCIKVDKENFSMQSFYKVSDLLKDGRAVLIFPEGQVNREEGSMLSFKTGAVLMAHKNKAPILPVYVSTGEKWYEKNVVVIGDPIDLREVCGDFPTMDALQRASELIREREQVLKEYCETSIIKSNGR